MKGQMTLNEKTMSWEYTRRCFVTHKPSIQSRNGWFKAWNGHLTMNCNTLEEAIIWTESKSN